MWVLVITVLALLAGVLWPADSNKYALAEAFLAVRDLMYEALKARYTLEAGSIWEANEMRILIRGHYPALFRSMCKSANVHTIGNDAARTIRSLDGGHALLRGTAGTGTSAFMFVMFIEFLKMLRAPATEEAVEVDGVVVFNPAVASIKIQWDGVYGGKPIVLGDALDTHCRVCLFDAGNDEPVERLPASQGQGYFLATASATEHYQAWDSKQLNLRRQYSVLWSVAELLRLIDVLGLSGELSEDQVHDRYAVVGGIPRLILERAASKLLETVKDRVQGITRKMVRMAIKNDAHSRQGLLRTGTGTTSFSMFAMDVKAEGDFDDVQVCHPAPRVKCGIGTRYSVADLHTLAGEVPLAYSRNRVLCAIVTRDVVGSGSRPSGGSEDRSRPHPQRFVRELRSVQVISRRLPRPNNGACARGA